MIAGMFVAIGPEYAKLIELRGQAAEAKEALAHVEAMKQAILTHGWDGEWFLRAYDFFGHKIGSKECEEGKILIESQGWCVMAGVGLDNGYAEKALDSVR